MPQLVIFLSLMAGVVAGHQAFYVLGDAARASHFLSLSWAAMFLVAVYAAVAYFRDGRSGKTDSQGGTGILAATFFFMLGMSTYARYCVRHRIAWPQERVSLSGVVVSVSEARGEWMRCTLATPQGHVRAYMRDSLPLGTVVRAETRVIWPERYRDNGFDYPLWLYVQGFVGVTYMDDCVSTVLPSGQSYGQAVLLPPLEHVQLKARQLQQRLVQAYDANGLGSGQAALAAALTLGDRSRVSAETRTAYTDAGAAHLLALSGLHLGIIIGFFSWLLGRRLLRYSRWRLVTVPLLVLFVWAYAFVAGMPASLVRASLMSTVILLMFLTRRDVSLLYGLCLAAFLMLLFRPVYLLDVGAQLSFAAVLGIALVYSPLVRLFHERLPGAYKWLHRAHLWWAVSCLMVSLSAWLFTAPLVFHYFHNLAPWGIVMNVVYIPVVTLLIYLCLLFLLLSLCGAPAWMLASMAWLLGLLMDAHLWLMQ